MAYVTTFLTRSILTARWRGGNEWEVPRVMERWYYAGVRLVTYRYAWPRGVEVSFGQWQKVALAPWTFWRDALNSVSIR